MTTTTLTRLYPQDEGGNDTEEKEEELREGGCIFKKSLKIQLFLQYPQFAPVPMENIEWGNLVL